MRRLLPLALLLSVATLVGYAFAQQATTAAAHPAPTPCPAPSPLG